MNGKASGTLPLLVLGMGAVVVLYGLGEALAPLLIAVFMAYLLLPLVTRLEARGVKREIAVAAALLIGFVILVALLTLLVPALIEDLRSFLEALPRIAETAVHKADLLATRFGLDLPLGKEDLIAQAKVYLSELPVGTLKSVGLVFGRAVSGAAGLVLSVLNLILIPIFFFYLIADSQRIVGGVRSLVPPRHLGWFNSFMSRSNEIVSAYFRGQFLVAVILGALYGIGFSVAGLRFGFVIGLLTGLLNVIPYAGPLIGLVLASTVALANYEGMGSIVGVWAVFAVVQGLEGFVITPKIVGDRVGLNALETMIALIVGGNLGGFLGMLVAIPFAGIAKFILMECKRAYLKSDLYANK